MGFEKVYVTERGLELEAKAKTGKTLKMLRVEVGDGNLSSSNIAKQTTLVNKILDCPINSLKQIGNQTVANFILEQSKIESGFYFREFGIIAENPDTQEEILYMYANAGSKAEYVNDKTSVTISDKIIDIIIKEDNVDNITISIDSTGVYVEKQEYQNKIAELSESISTKANQKKTYNVTIDTMWTGTEAPYTKTIVVEGITADDIPHLELIQSATIETAIREQENFNKISKIISNAGSVTLICYEEKPEISLDARIEVMY